MPGIRHQEWGIIIDTHGVACRDGGFYFDGSNSVAVHSSKGKGKEETSSVCSVHSKGLLPQHRLPTNAISNHQTSKNFLAHQLLDQWRPPSSIHSYGCDPDCYPHTVGFNEYAEFMSAVDVSPKPNTGRPGTDSFEKHKCFTDERISHCHRAGGVYFGNFSDVYPLPNTPPPVEIMSGHLDGASYLPFQPEGVKSTTALSTTRASGRTHTRVAPPTPIVSRKGSKAVSVCGEGDFVQGKENITHLIYRPSSFSTSKPLTAARLGAMIRELEADENKNPLYWAVTYNRDPHYSSPTIDTTQECAHTSDGIEKSDLLTQVSRMAQPATYLERGLFQAAAGHGNKLVNSHSSYERANLPTFLPSPGEEDKKDLAQEPKKYIPIIAVKPLPEVRPVISLDGYLVLDYSMLDGKCDCAKEILLERTRKLPHWFAFKAGQYLTTDPQFNCEKCTKWLGINYSQRFLLKRVSLTTSDVYVRPSQLAAAIGIIRRYSGKVNSIKIDFPPDVGLYTRSDISKLCHCLKTLQEILPFGDHIQVRRLFDNPKLGKRWKRVDRKNFCEVAIRWIKQDIKNVSDDVRKGIRVEMPSYYF